MNDLYIEIVGTAKDIITEGFLMVLIATALLVEYSSTTITILNTPLNEAEHRQKCSHEC